jgi:hypothetical protein
MITRHEVAVEEAAHAVACLHFGWEIREGRPGTETGAQFWQLCSKSGAHA